MNIRVDIWHNILWSRYKGGVFSELHRECVRRGVVARFFQIAETENVRRGLAKVDLSYHKYPYRLIAEGSYQDIPRLRLIWVLFWSTLTSPADIVVLAGYHKIEYWAQLAAARVRGKRVMVFCDSTSRDRPRRTFKSLLKRQFFRRCDGFFCYGQRSRDYLLSYRVPPANVFIRCQAAALPHDYDASRALRNRLGLLRSGGPPTVLFVGRFAPEKNLPALLEAFRKLRDESSACVLALVGDGPERAALEAIVTRLALNDAVTFPGALSGEALYDSYAGATCLVLPSLSEPWGLVVNEALSFGCPVVVSDRCGCVPELVVEGVTGFSFAAADVESLATAMARAIEMTREDPSTSERCIQFVSKYTPSSAASNVLAGLMALGNARSATVSHSYLTMLKNGFAKIGAGPWR